MLFNSAQFIIFLPIVLVVFFILPKKIRNYWLLVASYYFYMCWNVEFGFLILFSTAVTYAAGLFMEKIKQTEDDERIARRDMKWVVAISFIVNLSILFYFKYFNFAGELVNFLFAKTGILFEIPKYDIMLPVGISFYTFQALGYTVDVYRGEIKAERNFFNYALFVSFFPQLVAGPIERSKNLLHQIKTPTKFSYDHFKEGLLLMLWGYFLKIVFADRVAIFVDSIFRNLNDYTGWYLVVAVVFFGLQIYCDFYGYSVIAKGTALMLNIELMENFKSPFLSASVAEFWRNWHISLTSWFKDYLYFPLGGSRKGKARKYFNKMVVFLVSGLWHGASMNFVIWGGINGLYQVIGEITEPYRIRLRKALGLRERSEGLYFIQVFLTFTLIMISFVFFRCHTMQEVGIFFHNMLAENNFWIFFDGSLYFCGLNYKNFVLIMFSMAVITFADHCKKRGIAIRYIILKQDAWIRIPIFVILICFILIYGIWGPGYEGANFIYFQF